MAYKDQSHWAAPLEVAEQNNLYSTFNSLRKAVAYSNPHRGVLLKSYFSEDVVERTNALAHGKQYDHALAPLHHSKSPKKHGHEAVRYAYDEHGHRIAVSHRLLMHPPSHTLSDTSSFLYNRLLMHLFIHPPSHTPSNPPFYSQHLTFL